MKQLELIYNLMILTYLLCVHINSVVHLYKYLQFLKDKFKGKKYSIILFHNFVKIIIYLYSYIENIKFINVNKF